MASSRLLSVQLVDARAFRLVTGLPPPETPVTAEACAALGLPFFQLVGKGRARIGVAGEWNGLTGVGKAVRKGLGLGGSGSKRKSQGKGKGSENRRKEEDEEDYGDIDMIEGDGGSGEWDLLKTGAWGRLRSRGEEVKADSPDNGSDDDRNEQFGEKNFDMPLVLLGVDDTVPKFKSIVKQNEFEHDEEDLYD